jgi:hypothetical protein
MRARSAGIVGVAVAFAIAGAAIIKRNRPVEIRAVETTRAIRIVRRDRSGLPEKQGVVRDPAHVRALTEALGVDLHPGGPCPPDYADADIGIVLAGDDVYARRNVYVFALLGDAGEPSVVSVTSAGCRVGPAADVASLRRELETAKILDARAIPTR